MRLRNRFLLLTSLIFLGFMLVVFVLARQMLDNLNQGWGRQFAERQVQADKNRTLVPLINEIALARKMASDPDIIAFALDEANPAARKRGLDAMERYRTLFSDHSDFAAIASSGDYYFADSSNENRNGGVRYVLSTNNPNDRWFYATLKDGRAYQLNVDPDVHLGITKVWINTLIRHGNETLGIVGTGIDLTDFLKRTVSIPQKGIVNLFVDRNMAIQLHGDPKLIDYMGVAKQAKEHVRLDVLIKDPDDLKEIDKALREAKRSPEKVKTLWVRYQGSRYMLGISYLPEVDWFDLTLMNPHELNFARDMGLLPVYFFLALLISLFLMGVALHRWVLVPISMLKNSVEKINRGDFDISIPGRGMGEISELSDSFSKMAQSIRGNRDLLESEVRRQTEELQNANRLLQQDIHERKLAEAAVLEKEYHYRMAIETSEDGFLMFDELGKILEVNDSYVRMSGFMRDELLKIHVYDLDADHGRELVSAKIESIIRNGGHENFETRLRKIDGSIFPVRVSVSCTEGERVFFAFITDLTGSKEAEEAMQLASLVYQNSSEAMLVTDADNRIIAINPAFTDITGYRLEDVKGKNPNIFASGHHEKDFYQSMWHCINLDGYWHGVVWDRRRDGEKRAMQLSINTIRNDAGEVYRHVALMSDITEKKKSEELIWRQANYDQLTGLPNRQMFYDRFGLETRKSHRNGRKLALLLIDLDRFKEINDTLGHDKGDMLLVEAARRIFDSVRESDTVARLGGDEFVVILTDLEDLSGVDRIAQNIIDRLTEPFVLTGEDAFISASIGISIYPDDSHELDDLFKGADQAMYAAKNAGRNRFRYFTREMQEVAQKRLRLANDMRLALSLGQFFVYYQPIVDMKTGEIFKAEALIRWFHPAHGMISPAEFIPLAEETGLIVPIGDWVFKKAIEQCKSWREKFHDFQISINKSPVQMRSKDSLMWNEYLRMAGVPGQAVYVEITEGLLLDPEPQVNRKLLEFRDDGIQVSIDDFGTGYSSLSYLKEFDIDFLKIDRSFVRNLAPGTSELALCEAIVVMAHKLGMKVVAEGVETERQRDLLLQIGCDFAQGFLYSPPVSAEDFERLLEDQAESFALS